MFLPAKGKLPVQRGAMQRAQPVELGLHVAALNTMRRGVKTLGGQRFGDRQDRRQRFVFDLHRVGGQAAGITRFADDQRDQLAVKGNFLVREQDLILADRAHVVFAGHVLGQQHGVDPGHRAGGGGVAPEDARAGVRRADGPYLQRALGRTGIVHVARRARDVADRAFVRGDGHGRQRGRGGDRAAVRRDFRCAVEIEKFLQQPRDEAAPVLGGCAHVVDGRQFFREDAQRGVERAAVPGLADQRRLGAPGAHGGRGDPAVDQARIRHAVVGTDFDAEPPRHHADVHFPSAGNLEGIDQHAPGPFARGTGGGISTAQSTSSGRRTVLR